MRITSFFAAVLLIGSVSAADLESSLRPLIDSHQGDVAIVIRHLDTGEQFVWRETVVQPTASLIKLPVMVTAYRQADAGTLDLTRMVTLKEEDKVPGSGILTGHFSTGLNFSVRDAIRLMIRYSDNTATNLVVDQIGLPSTAEDMTILGYPETRLHAKVYRGDTSIAPERSRQYGLGSTTAIDIVNLLSSIHKETVAKPESCKAMIEHLLACEDRGMLAKELPATTKLAHKTGAVGNSRCDAGILMTPKGPIAICVLTTNNKDQRWDDDNAAHVLMGKIGRIAFEHFNPAWDAPSPGADLNLKVGAFGEQVEYLQRTLNLRLQPSPGLGVDGDFGPATEAAVKLFQERNSLAVDGIVNSQFWKALGPVAEETEVPAPEVVNAEVLPKQPADSLEGAPFVSCDAWTIVDAADGRELAGKDSAVRRDFASTTKMMTAWLVAELASRKPEVLEETLTMSVRADETRGSTADLRSGEQVTVHDALFGLMLPSGNDMSVALAEHFGNRVARDEATATAAAASQDPLEQFVAVMNAEASSLGMSETHYVNPHGMTDKDHLSTAMDLSRLARRMLTNELLRKVTSTRQYGTTVTGAAGYQRNVLWKNTNELLGIEGFDGMKTGTTDQAGACLVSTGERNGRRLIIVVLGSAASEARYTDSRNLYRWAWKELIAQ